MRSLLMLLLVSIFFGCKKDNDVAEIQPPPPPPPIPLADSLGMGWSKVVNAKKGSAVYDIFFVNAYTGYAATNDGLFRSIDSGKTFNKISNTPLQNLGINNLGKLIGTGIYDRDKNAYYLNDADSLIKTIFPVGTDIIGLSDCFYYGNVCYYSNDTHVYKSTDGGVSANVLYTITSVAITNPTYVPVFCLDANKVFTASVERFQKSDNGGVNWTTTDLNSFKDSTFKSAIFFVNDAVGFISSRKSIYKTIDGGNSFSRIFTTTYEQGFFDIHFISATIGFASNGPIIY
jgi:hypothetical protein